jgi:ATP-dependent helicase/nuclease subunit A
MAFMLYRSSAGSGKTYTLVKEYLKLVLENPESEKFKHILAITFTNKAAGEMKDRILQALKNLAKGEDKVLEDTLKKEMPDLRHVSKISAKVLTDLLHKFSDFAIMTIDSFIHRVIKAFALEIGLPLNFGIDLNYEKIQDYVIEHLLASVGKEDYITELLLKFVFARVQAEKSWNIEGEIKKFEKELFNEKNINWVRAVSTFDSVVFEHYTKKLEHLRDDFTQKLNEPGKRALDLIKGAGLSAADFAYKEKGAAGFLEKCAVLRPEGIKQFSLSSRLKNEQWYTKSAPGEIKAAIENLLAHGLSQIRQEVMDHWEKYYSRALTADFILDNIYLSAIISRMTLLVDEYKKKNNMIPISEFNVRVNEIVRDSPVPFIYAVLGERYNHYLVDEFQDTSRLQWENLLPLIDNAMASDYFCMAVGDGKQSIYRWRGSDWGIMQKEIEEKIAPEQLTVSSLGQNFRSRENIVVFNNRFFEKVSEYYKSDNIELGRIYMDITQEPKPKPGGFVSLCFFDQPSTNTAGAANTHFDTGAGMDVDDDTDTDTDTDIDADVDLPVFEQVKKIIMDCRVRGFNDRDIAILVRENKQGQRVGEYLLGQGIQVVSPDSLILSRIPLIRFLIDILVYLGNPSDKIVEAAIIFFLGLNKGANPLEPTAVADHFLEDKQRDLSGEIAEFFRRRNYLIRMPVYEVIEEVIRIFELDKSLDFVTHGYLQAFLDVVAGYTAENSVDIASFLDWWEFNKGEFSVMVPETKAAIKIMSIHKAKGLEFPVVILPYAAWEHKPDRQLWLKANPALPTDPPLDMPMPVNKTKKLEETYFRAEYARESEKVTVDNINLLYVAFTRTIDELYIISRRKERNENYKLLNERAVPLMEAGKSNGDQNVFTFGEPSLRKKEKEEGEQELLEIGHKTAEQLISNNWYSRITIRRKSREFWRFDENYREERRTWGILIHQVLSGIRSIDDIDSVLEQTLAAGEIEAEDREPLEQKIREIFEIETVRGWFKPGYADRVFIESPIITDEGTLRPDRVIIAGDHVTLIDFKTGKPVPRDEQQMITYKNAVRAMGYREDNIDAFLFYLEDKEVRRIGIRQGKDSWQ